MIRIFILLLLGLTALSVQADGLRVEQAWARATPPVVPNAAAYLTLVNEGPEPDRLLEVSSPVARRVELHESRIKDGMMTMRAVEGALEVPAGGSLALAPQGRHIMLMGLESALQAGDSFPLTLRLEKAGEVTVEVAVRKTAP